MLAGNQILDEELKIKVFSLCRAGWQYPQIAKHLGVSVAQVSSCVRAQLRELKSINDELFDEVRELELSRLDEILMALYPRALKADLSAVDRVLRLMERRAKYLGIDAPTKVDHTGKVSLEQLIGGSYDAKPSADQGLAGEPG